MCNADAGFFSELLVVPRWLPAGDWFSCGCGLHGHGEGAVRALFTACAGPPRQTICSVISSATPPSLLKGLPPRRKQERSKEKPSKAGRKSRKGASSDERRCVAFAAVVDLARDWKKILTQNEPAQCVAAHQVSMVLLVKGRVYEENPAKIRKRA